MSVWLSMYLNLSNCNAGLQMVVQPLKDFSCKLLSVPVNKTSSLSINQQHLQKIFHPSQSAVFPKKLDQPHLFFHCKSFQHLLFQWHFFIIFTKPAINKHVCLGINTDNTPVMNIIWKKKCTYYIKYQVRLWIDSKWYVEEFILNITLSPHN